MGDSYTADYLLDSLPTSSGNHAIIKDKDIIDLKIEHPNQSSTIENNCIVIKTETPNSNILENSDIEQTDCIAINKNANIDDFVDVKKDSFLEKTPAIEHVVSKIEITEHSLELENMQILENIYKEYDKNIADSNISQISPEIQKHEDVKYKKLRKPSSQKKKTVQTNTLDGFVTRDKNKTGPKRKVPPEIFETLFVRIERIDISDKLHTIFQSRRSADIPTENNNLGTGHKNKTIVCETKSGAGSHNHQTKLLTKVLKKNVVVQECHCYPCSRAYKSQKDLIDHLNQCHKEVSKSKFQCYHCDKVVMYGKSLISHIAQHHTNGEKLFHCDTCTYKTNLKQALRLHYIRHLPDDQKQNFKCNYCTHVPKTRGSLHMHLRKKHSDRIFEHIQQKPLGLEFFCYRCNFKTKKKICLANHQQVHSNNNYKKFSCPKCPYQAKNETRIKLHSKTHENTFKKCPECPRTVKESSLPKHIRVHHSGRKKKKCPMCGLEFFGLEGHMKTHGNYERKKCPECLFSSVSKGYLNRHMRQCHKNEKNPVVICYLCNKEFEGKYGLRSHIQYVHKKIPCDCPICGKTLRSKMYLTGHLKRMHGDTMFECDLCPKGKRYRSKIKAKLKLHRLTHFSKEELVMYKCEYCPYESKSFLYLRRHIVRHHKKQFKKIKGKNKLSSPMKFLGKSNGDVTVFN